MYMPIVWQYITLVLILMFSKLTSEDVRGFFYHTLMSKRRTTVVACRL